MEEFELSARIQAPPEKVWAVYSDHVGYEEWAGVKGVVLRQQGEPAPNGLGAIRVIRANGIAIEEEVTAFEPPKRFGYRMVSGVPVKDYVAEVLFEEADGGTQIRWRVRFAARIPGTGWLMKRVIKSSLSQMLERLTRVDFTTV